MFRHGVARCNISISTDLSLNPQIVDDLCTICHEIKDRSCQRAIYFAWQRQRATGRAMQPGDRLHASNLPCEFGKYERIVCLRDIFKVTQRCASQSYRKQTRIQEKTLAWRGVQGVGRVEQAGQPSAPR